jgi:IclR family acetate operon transcriptional repressor
MPESLRPNERSDSVEIQALAVVNQILEVLAESRTEVPVADLARALQMTPPRVWRYIHSMEALGMVETRSGARGYVLGWKLIRLGQKAAERANLNEVAFGPVTNLRDTLRETVYLAVPYNSGASVIMSLDGGDGTHVSLHVSAGAFFPSNSTSSGRVILAFASEEKLKHCLVQPLGSAGPDPITDAEQLRERLAQIRACFFDTAQTEGARRTSGTVFVNSISAPVFDHSNNAVAVVGVLTGLRGREAVSADPIRLPLFDCAATISRALGSNAWDAIHQPANPSR